MYSVIGYRKSIIIRPSMLGHILQLCFVGRNIIHWIDRIRKISRAARNLEAQA